MTVENMFANIPHSLPQELCEELARGAGVCIERIVSQGHRSPAEFWYDQPHDEWVVLLQGSAGLRFAGEPTVLTLHPGDYVNIPAHVRHRVEWTDARQQTVWLAIHYAAAGAIKPAPTGARRQ
jgi:cupin 2 domain-containing protein